MCLERAHHANLSAQLGRDEETETVELLLAKLSLQCTCVLFFETQVPKMVLFFETQLTQLPDFGLVRWCEGFSNGCLRRSSLRMSKP